ncbi:MAG: hypothetical protein ACOVKJ_02640 [Flavobacterium sp.]
MFDRKLFEIAIDKVATTFEKTAPTVVDWADFLASAKDAQISLADLHLLSRLATEDTPANYAANLVYHRMEQAGRCTTGHVGY